MDVSGLSLHKFLLVAEKLDTFAKKMSPLGSTPTEACADYVITLFSDLTRMVTMQNLYHDGGYSSTGISEELIQMMKEE